MFSYSPLSTRVNGFSLTVSIYLYKAGLDGLPVVMGRLRSHIARERRIHLREPISLGQTSLSAAILVLQSRLRCLEPVETEMVHRNRPRNNSFGLHSYCYILMLQYYIVNSLKRLLSMFKRHFIIESTSQP